MNSMFGSQQPPGTPAASEVTDNFAALPLRPHQRVHVLDGTTSAYCTDAALAMVVSVSPVELTPTTPDTAC